MKRRKFKPTHMERTVYGDAGGSSLNNVNAVEGVGRVGALSCWEHTQPLLKYHTISLREEIHVAAWPPLHPHSDGNEGLFSMTADGEFIPYFSSLLILRLLHDRLLDRCTHAFQAAQHYLKPTPLNHPPSCYIARPS